MTDSSEVRSRTMRAVRSLDTDAEMRVRRLVHSLGYRYRLHQRGLPGTPDLVFPARHAVIFVHGCFWHQHDCRRGSRVPRARRDYWERKLRGNQERDRRNQDRLRKMGWRVFIVWECEITDQAVLSRRLCEFLDAGKDRD